MYERDLVEILSSYYGSSNLLTYSESEDEIRCQLSPSVRNMQSLAFRSRAALLSDLALSHRLALWAGRTRLAIPQASAFAISSIKAAATSSDSADTCSLFLRWEVTGRRGDVVTAMKSVIVTEQDGEARETIMALQVLPPALANFVRRTRQFMDFAEVKMSRDEPCCAKVDDNHFRYHSSEGDRLSDGKRVDHVPALTLIDIALFVCRGADAEATARSLSAEFLSYTDPRVPFDLLLQNNQGVIEVVQAGKIVATVQSSQSNSAIGERHCPLLAR